MSVGNTEEAISRLKVRLALIFFMAAAIIVGSGLVYYLHYRENLLKDASALLTSIEGFKLDQLNFWRADRLNDTLSLVDSPLLSSYVNRLAENPSDPELRRLLGERLSNYLKHNRYAAAALAGPDGKIMIAAGSSVAALCPEARALIRRAGATGEPEMGGFVISPGEKGPHIDLAALATRNKSGKKLFLMLRIDPADYLYPMLESWPTNSRSGETLLVAKEGDSVVFLNSVRHKPGPAMALRLPLAEALQPATRALGWQKGVFRGVDYRGVKVLAATALVPGTDWALVSKTDMSEVMADSATVSALLLSLVVLLLAAAGVLVFLLFRRQAAEYAEALTASNAGLREGERRMAALLSNLPGFAYRCANDRNWTQEFFSEGCLALTGYMPAEFVGSKGINYNDLVIPADRERTWSAVQAGLAKDGRFQVTYSIKCKDGSVKVVWSQGLAVKGADGKIVALEGYVSDISGLRKAERAFRDSEARYRETVELAVDGILLGDPDGKIIGANSQMQKLAGRSLAEILGLSAKDLFAPDELSAVPLRYDLLREGKTVISERRLLRPDGTTLQVEMHSKVMPDGTFQSFYRDITARRRAEAELRRSEEKFRLLTENSLVGVYVLQDGKVAYVNPCLAKTFGYSVEEVQSRNSLKEYFHPDDLPLLARRMKERLEGVPGSSVTYRLIRKDGSQFLAENFTVRIDYLGRPAVLGTLVDITERRLAEDRLRESEDRYRFLFEHNPMPMLIYETGTLQLLAVNEVFLKHYGYSSGEALALRLPDLYPEEQKAPIIALAGRLRGPASAGEWRHRRRDGSFIDVLAQSDDLSYKGRKARVAVLTDITARKQAETALRKSEDTLRQILEQSPISMAIISLDGTVEYINKKAISTFGYLHEEIPTLERWWAQAYPDPAYRAEAAAAWTSEEAVSGKHEIRGGECRVTCKDGSVKIVFIFGVVVADKVFVMFDDITRRRLEEMEREKLSFDLAEKKRELENFLYITTHDLRSPLVNIQGFSQNLEGYTAELRRLLDRAPLPPETGQAVEKLAGTSIPAALEFVLESSRKMDMLISALLKVSRMGRVEMKPENLEMNGLLKTIMASLRYHLEGARGTVKIGSLPPCKADPAAVSQIFTNLLDNAVKYRHKERALAVTVSGSVEGDMAVYEVADNGAGIPADSLPKIWSVFYQPVKSLTPGKKGEGIGLHMVKLMAEKNGGSIGVESKDGEGTVFRVRLPAK